MTGELGLDNLLKSPNAPNLTLKEPALKFEEPVLENQFRALFLDSRFQLNQKFLRFILLFWLGTMLWDYFTVGPDRLAGVLLMRAVVLVDFVAYTYLIFYSHDRVRIWARKCLARLLWACAFVFGCMICLIAGYSFKNTSSGFIVSLAALNHFTTVDFWNTVYLNVILLVFFNLCTKYIGRIPDTPAGLSLIASNNINIVIFMVFALIALYRYQKFMRLEFASRVSLKWTSAKRLEDERETSKRVKAADDAKTRFLAIVSHETRTPIQTIYCLAETLAESTTLSPDDRESVNIIMKSAETLSGLLANVLHHTKLESKQTRIQMGTVDLHSLVEDVVDVSIPEVLRKGFEIVTRIRDAPNLVCGDKDRISQILTNLVDNAIKFTQQGCILIDVGSTPPSPSDLLFDFSTRPENENFISEYGNIENRRASDSDCLMSSDGSGGVSVNLPRTMSEVWLNEVGPSTGSQQNEAALVTKGVLYLTVCDTGCGIPAEIQGKIFEEFFTVDDPKTRKFSGSGLGLSICLSLAKAMNGHITVHSEVGKGSVFTITLPWFEPTGPLQPSPIIPPATPSISSVLRRPSVTSVLRRNSNNSGSIGPTPPSSRKSSHGDFPLEHYTFQPKSQHKFSLIYNKNAFAAKFLGESLTNQGFETHQGEEIAPFRDVMAWKKETKTGDTNSQLVNPLSEFTQTVLGQLDFQLGVEHLPQGGTGTDDPCLKMTVTRPLVLVFVDSNVTPGAPDLCAFIKRFRSAFSHTRFSEGFVQKMWSKYLVAKNEGHCSFAPLEHQLSDGGSSVDHNQFFGIPRIFRRSLEPIIKFVIVADVRSPLRRNIVINQCGCSEKLQKPIRAAKLQRVVVALSKNLTSTFDPRAAQRRSSGGSGGAASVGPGSSPVKLESQGVIARFHNSDHDDTPSEINVFHATSLSDPEVAGILARIISPNTRRTSLLKRRPSIAITPLPRHHHRHFRHSVADSGLPAKFDQHFHLRRFSTPLVSLRHDQSDDSLSTTHSRSSSRSSHRIVTKLPENLAPFFSPTTDENIEFVKSPLERTSTAIWSPTQSTDPSAFKFDLPPQVQISADASLDVSPVSFEQAQQFYSGDTTPTTLAQFDDHTTTVLFVDAAMTGVDDDQEDHDHFLPLRPPIDHHELLTFTFPPPNIPSGSPPPPPVMPKILIVEDNAIIRKSIQRMLSSQYECFTAEDGQQCLNQIELMDFDVILLDYHMPVMDGAEACRQIRLRSDCKRNTPIILVTADELDGSSPFGSPDTWINAYIPKPAKKESLAIYIEALLQDPSKRFPMRT